MKEPYGGTVTDISSAERILGDKMATGPTVKTKESSLLETQEQKSFSYKTYEVEVDKMFQCKRTGIKFDVQSTTIIKYSLEYGDEYTNLIQKHVYELLGPIFNVQVISGRVSAVHLPHYVCLEDFKGDKSMIKFGHFKDGEVTLKTPTRIDDSYVVLEDPSFSRVAAIGEPFTSLLRRKKYPYNGQVLIYFRVLNAEDKDNMEYRIHLFLIPTDKTLKEELNKRKEGLGFSIVDKSSVTKSVYKKKTYIIKGNPNLKTQPKPLQFMLHKELDYYPYAEINFTKDVETISLFVEAEKSSEKGPVWDVELTKADIKELCVKAAQRGDPPKNFIQKHFSDLVQNVSNIGPVLDHLKKEGFVALEEYDTIMSELTPQNQMRKLLRSVENWDGEDVETFREVLRRHNKSCMKKIEKEN